MRIVPQVDDTREMDLFRRAQTGDRGAFGQLAIRLQDRLYNAILRVVGDREEARELTQEAFVKALTKIETFRGDSQPFTWMFRIGVNLAISHLRKVQRRRTFSLDAPRNGSDDQASALVDRIAADDSSPTEAIERRETQEQVLAALGRLDAEYRTILVMRDIEDMDYQQMADVLNIPLGTLKSKLFRARLAMREQMVMVMKEGARSQEPGARR
jgi:RNA polymerase sigma-70 factor (ECF subfamily)